MTESIKYSDLKYEDRKKTIEDAHITEKFPIIARTCNFERQQDTEIPLNKEILFQNKCKETFAHIKVLPFYNNDKQEKEHGAEYVLEHETCVGKEYLMSLGFGRMVKYTNKSGSQAHYANIKQVIEDCPAFVRVEKRTTAHLSHESKQIAVIPAKTVLELRRLRKTETKNVYLECSDGRKTYEFNENMTVAFSMIERDKLYSLTELTRTPLLPQVILFQDVNPTDIVLTDNELRSAMSTVVQGPIQVLGFAEVKYLKCWIRNKTLKTYETMLIPETLWNKTYIQMRCFHTEIDKEKYVSQKYGPCFGSDFVSKSLYVMPVDLQSSIWLRSPDFFKQKLDGNEFFEVMDTPFTYSSDDDDNVYTEIEEQRPPVPKKGKRKALNVMTKRHGNDGENDEAKNKQELEKNEKVSKIEETPEMPPKALSNELGMKRNQNYTLLEFSNPYRTYEKLNTYGDSAPMLVPLGYSDSSVDKSAQYIELGQVRKVLDDKQTDEDFYKYTVKEVSFCFEHCGLKELADLCYKKKLDGSFFKGFADWSELNMSNLDVLILKKVIYEGWRSKDDSTYSVSTPL